MDEQGNLTPLLNHAWLSEGFGNLDSRSMKPVAFMQLRSCLMGTFLVNER
jgi:hypothetical protein